MPDRHLGRVILRRGRASAVALGCLAWAAAWPGTARAQGGPEVRAGTSRDGLYHEVRGRGDAVVMIHGFSLDRRMWDREVEALATGFRVIRYDLAGHGRSPLPDEPFFPHEQLRALLDELGVDRAALIGLSAGAAVAVDFALAYPARVTRLVLAAPGVGGYTPTTPPPPDLLRVFEVARRGDALRAAELWAGTEMMRVPAADALAVRQMVLDNAALWSVTSSPQRPLSPPAWERLEAVRAPTLVLVGDADTADVRAVAAALASRVPRARQVVLPDAGHLLTYAAQAAFTREVLAFLRSK